MIKKDWWREAFEKGVYPLETLASSSTFREITKTETKLLWKSLGLKKGSRVLDVCCGTGRHAIALAKKGAKVTGIDISSKYLKAARADAKKAGVKVDFVRADARDFSVKDGFDAAICMFTSLGYSLDRKDDLKTVKSVRRALRPGGRFFLDMVEGERIERILRFNEDNGITGEHWAEFEDGSFVLEEPHFDKKRNACITDWIFLGGNGKKRRELTSFCRLYGKSELTRLFKDAGLRVRAAFADADGSPHRRAVSPRIILVGERPSGRR